MSLGLVGRKVGMTRIFTDDGIAIPVTVLEITNNRIAQIKTPQKDGYSAVQVAYGHGRPNKINKPKAGHLAKFGIADSRGLHEFTVDEAVLPELESGQEISVSIFSVGQLIDVTGTTQGKGFSGGIKRHGFTAQPASHGNSRTERAPGSTGQAQDPGRVFPGKKMAGQYGNVQCTTHNLEIVRVDNERGLLFIKGAVPGAKNNDIIIRPAVKVGK